MTEPSRTNRSPWEVFVIFLRLGLISFGGPIAHLGYFRDEFVARRQWLSERDYAQLVALCQFLPGPASSQVGIAIGLSRAGYAGALAAWSGFTLPSAIALILVALGIAKQGEVLHADVLHGLKVVAVAVVAQAVWSMARSHCPDLPRLLLMVAATCVVLLVPSGLAQMGVMAMAALLGAVLIKPHAAPSHAPLPIGVGRRAGVFWLALFTALLLGLPLLVAAVPGQMLSMIDVFYRTGSLVFGGGHVALPLLQAQVVPSGWVDNDVFLAGYGAVQAVPGPLFTFAAFLGASMNQGPSGWLGAVVCLVAIFVPSFLLVFGCLPFWEGLRRNQRAQAALLGVNAAVVGLLLAAFYDPVWTSAIQAPQDLALAILALVALMRWKLPTWLVVAASGGLGGVISAVFQS